MNWLINVMNYRPNTTIAVISALHSLAVGVGFIFNLAAVKALALYPLVIFMTPQLFGLLFVVVSIVTIAGLVLERSGLVSYGSDVQSAVWLFTFILYVINGYWYIGLINAIFWSIIAGYTGFAFKHIDKDKGVNHADGA